MTNFELALALVRLGAVTARRSTPAALDAMAFDGQLLNRPSDPAGERAVASALLVAYSGVYAPPPREPVLSPNGDGVAETQALAYKLVRPSTVQATLVGPDGAARAARLGRAAARARTASRWTGRTATLDARAARAAGAGP